MSRCGVFRFVVYALPITFGLVATGWAADPFADLVRTTEPLTPAEELAAFQPPPGFEMQLVAAEPELRKPMNLAWDTRGRLWFTESREYPFPAKLGEPARDSVRILSDFDESGRAKKVTIFADGLNIPIGLYPFRSKNKDGNVTTKCIVWSIPNIWLLEDTDGDDKADTREALYGPLGWERDTHGNLASFRRGADGMLYATHGFNNVSTMRGKDGSEIKMSSGNTWRATLDGQHVEQISYGQVNPFGLCFDARGNMFTADCHSSPIYQLLRGGCYPSFGKPHDGLGFAPTTIQHTHGSTALCGVVYLSDPAWPQEYLDNIIVGNVATSRINRDHIEWRGTSSVGHEQPDLLSTKDPWFRPVDLQWGPDGALYIADFYNRIIGHYEVPLTHPGRDRERGRIWRMVYKGDKAKPDLRSRELPTDIPGLVAELGSPDQTRRTLALHELCDVHGEAALEELERATDTQRDPLQRSLALQAIERIAPLTDERLIKLVGDPRPAVALQALHILRDREHWSPKVVTAVLNGLKHVDAFCRRAAVDGLARHARVETLPALIRSYELTPSNDIHTRQAMLIALRNQLRDSRAFEDLSWLGEINANTVDTFWTIFDALDDPRTHRAQNNLLTLQSKWSNSASKKFIQDRRVAMMKQCRNDEQAEALLNTWHIRKFDGENVDDIELTVACREIIHADAKKIRLRLNLDLLEFLEKSSPDSSRKIELRLRIGKFFPEEISISECSKELRTSSRNETRLLAAQVLLARQDLAPVIDEFSPVRKPGIDPTLQAILVKTLIERRADELLPTIFDALRFASAQSQAEATKALTGWKVGTSALFEEIEAGRLSTQLLRDKALQTLVRAHKDKMLDQRLNALLEKLPPENVALDKLIAARRGAARKSPGTADAGKTVFVKNCAACHKLAGEGALLGPQLDGIGIRGLDRVLEDILDPNRNVDKAFRMTVVTRDDGTIVNGLIRNEEGDDLVLADQTGKELRIPKKSIEERAETANSLMPSVAETLPERDLLDLAAFLLTQKETKKDPEK